MRCPNCGAYGVFENGVCHRCGTLLRSSRLPVKRDAPSPPAVWRQAAPVVVRGAALIAAGLAAEWLLRSAARRAFVPPAALGKSADRTRALAPKPERRRRRDGVLAVSETMIMRRVILRR